MKQKKIQKNISVIFPAYNEEENIERCVEKARHVLNKLVENFEIIVVNDGSTDGTEKVCCGLRDKFQNFKFISKAKNEGYGYAVRDGINGAVCDLVFFSDSDEQFDISELEDLLKYANDYDIVIGYRKKRHDPLKRKIFSFSYNTVIRILFGLSVKDLNCAFKLFNRRIFDNIRIESRNYLINAEILMKACYRGFSIKEIPVSHFPRSKGKSKIQFSDIPRTVKEIIRLYTSRKEWQKK